MSHQGVCLDFVVCGRVCSLGSKGMLRFLPKSIFCRIFEEERIRLSSQLLRYVMRVQREQLCENSKWRSNRGTDCDSEATSKI